MEGLVIDQWVELGFCAGPKLRRAPSHKVYIRQPSMDTVTSVRVSFLSENPEPAVRDKARMEVHGDTGEFLAVDQSLDAGFKLSGAKIEKIAETQIRQANIGQDLLGVHRKKRLDRFQFQENPILNNYICAKPFLEDKFIISDRY
jgi:hypothetical protein